MSAAANNGTSNGVDGCTPPSQAAGLPRAIYLDNNATTRPAPAVVQAMQAALTDFWHNPSSIHRPGQAARQKVELARKEVAALIGAKPRSIIFTGSGTEALDLAIRGTLAASGKKGILTTAIEHGALRGLARSLAEHHGYNLRLATLGDGGVVDPASIERQIDDSIGIVSVQWANNETGCIHPVDEIGRICRAKGVTFHCDGTQWVGKMPVNVGDVPASTGHANAANIDILTFSPHKFHGPKGVGVLYARTGVRFTPTIHGEQELGRRGGTENVSGIVGAGIAAKLAREWLVDEGHRARAAALRDRFEAAVIAACPGARCNAPADRSKRLWNTASIGFPKLEADALLLLLSERGVCASAGSACSSGSLEPSPVIKAMGIPQEFAHGTVRFSICRETTEADIDAAVRTIAECVAKLRQSMVHDSAPTA